MHHSQMIVPFEYKPMLEMDIDYTRDAKWGWIPTAWRITRLLADGTRRQVVEAKVSNYSINRPVGSDEFQIK